MAARRRHPRHHDNVILALHRADPFEAALPISSTYTFILPSNIVTRVCDSFNLNPIDGLHNVYVPPDNRPENRFDRVGYDQSEVNADPLVKPLFRTPSHATPATPASTLRGSIGKVGTPSSRQSAPAKNTDPDARKEPSDDDDDPCGRGCLFDPRDLTMLRPDRAAIGREGMTANAIFNAIYSISDQIPCVISDSEHSKLKTTVDNIYIDIDKSNFYKLVVERMLALTSPSFVKAVCDDRIEWFSAEWQIILASIRVIDQSLALRVYIFSPSTRVTYGTQLFLPSPQLGVHFRALFHTGTPASFYTQLLLFTQRDIRQYSPAEAKRAANIK